MRNKERHYTIPSRVYVDKHAKRWTSKEVAKYVFSTKDSSVDEFSIVFMDETVEELVQSVYQASIKAASLADSILKADKNKEEVSAEDKSYLYVVATKFSQAVNNAIIYEVMHKAYVISDSPHFYYTVAATNEKIRKAAKCKAFKKASGEGYNHEFWKRPDDAIRNTWIPGVTRLEKYLIEKKLLSANVAWSFYQKTQLLRDLFYYARYKDIVPFSIIASQTPCRSGE